jgi:hypothetical protein
MAYQTINPYTEELVKTFSEHTDAQLFHRRHRAAVMHTVLLPGRTISSGAERYG